MASETYGYDPGWTTDLGVHHQANPTSLQGVLASIPGLGSYLAMDQYLRQRDQAERNQPQNDEMRQIVLDTKRAELQKRQAANALMTQFGSLEKASPDQLDQLAVAHIASGDHANGAAIMKVADTKRAKLQEIVALSGMRSTPEVPAVGETGPNVPAAAKPGAVPDYLVSSPYVGKSAQALRDRINTGFGFTSTSAEKAIENLQTAHNTMAQRIDDAAAARQGRVDLLDQRGEQKLNVTGGRESVYVQRMMMGANQASKDLANVVQLPLTASTGIFGGRKQGPGLFDAGKEVLANKATGQEAQAYNAMATGFQRSLAQIESAGLMPSGSLTHQMDAVLFKEGDTNLTKLHKLAQTRQIVEAGMEVVDANPRVSPEEKAKVKTVLESIRKSVPFTHSDLIQLQILQDTNPNATLKDVISKKSSGWSIRPR